MTARKSINVNLNGTAYQLDEAAFNLVDDYLKSVEKLFKSDPDHEELSRDFEQAIADKLETANVTGRKVGSLKLVKEILDKIGPVETATDLEADLGVKNKNSKDSQQDDKSKSENKSSAIMLETGKKLYKSSEDKILDGVCAGLGLYFGIDPTWVRVAVVLLGLVTAGWPVLVGYIILSVILPRAITAEQKLEAKGKPLDASNLAYQTKERLERAEQAAKAAINETSKSIQSSRGPLVKLAKFFDRLFRLSVLVLRRVISLLGSGVSAAIFLVIVGLGTYGIVTSVGSFTNKWDWPLMNTSNLYLAAGWWVFGTLFVALPVFGLAWFFAAIDKSSFLKNTSKKKNRLGLVLVWLLSTLIFIGLTGLANKDLNTWSRRHGMEVTGFGINPISLEEDINRSGITSTVRYAENCHTINVVADEDFERVAPVMFNSASEVITHKESALNLKRICGEIYSIEKSADCNVQGLSSREIYISVSDLKAVEKGEEIEIRYITSKRSNPSVGYSDRICW
jgi:phage shock protein PspC (stress-responsive transcriptional regulator)